jgi:hypothetical protein
MSGAFHAKAAEKQERQDVGELPLRVVPEDAPGLFLVDDPVQGVADLLRVHQGYPQPRLNGEV